MTLTSLSKDCKAKIPANCRYHGYGKDLSDENYNYILHRVESKLADMEKAYKNMGMSEVYIGKKKQEGIHSCWERSLSVYQEALKLKPLPAPSIDAEPEIVELTNIAVGLFNQADVLAAYKNSPFPLKAITNASKARNLCAYTSLMFLRRFTDEDFKSDKPVEVIRRDAVDNKKKGMFWHHAALLTSYKGKKYVIDYTIRQFDLKLPMPWVGTVEDWEQTLEKANGEKWVSDHLSKFSVTGGETRTEALAAYENY